MCENCANWHNKWPDHKKHTVLAVNELSSPEAQAKIKSKLYCKKHHDKTLKFYCETCKVSQSMRYWKRLIMYGIYVMTERKVQLGPQTNEKRTRPRAVLLYGPDKLSE